MVGSVRLTPVATSVNGNVTFAYIMTFHCTSVFIKELASHV